MGRCLRRARAPRLQAPRPERDRRHFRQHHQGGRLAERPDRRLRLQRRRRRRRRRRWRRPSRHLLRRQQGLQPPVPQQGAHAVRGRHREGGRLDRTRWATGVSMVDINGDGALDIYVSVSGPEWTTPAQRANLLFVNDGKRHVHRAAAQYGIADSGLHHARRLPRLRRRRLPRPVRPQQLAQRLHSRRREPACPRAVRGQDAGQHQRAVSERLPRPLHRTCPSRPASCAKPGYGLGVVVSDLNGDGWPDIYVSNDVTPTTSSTSTTATGPSPTSGASWFQHASFAGMGVDIADFNNDGWPDVMQVDMMPNTLARRKRTRATRPSAACRARAVAAMRDDYSANSLQLSNGVTTDGRPRLQRGRPHRRRRAHRLELERAVRRLRQRWPQGPVHRQRLSEGRERSRLHDHHVARPYPGGVRRLSSRRHGGPQSPAGLRGAQLRLSQRRRPPFTDKPARGGWSARASPTARRTPISTTTAGWISS